jgi:hypothetical protein
MTARSHHLIAPLCKHPGRSQADARTRSRDQDLAQTYRSSGRWSSGRQGHGKFPAVKKSLRSLAEDTEGKTGSRKMRSIDFNIELCV